MGALFRRADAVRGCAMSRSLFAVLAERFEDRTIRVARRDALKTMSLAAGAMLLPGCAVSRKTPGRSGQRVVVVGAGFSGLAAADRLMAAGHEVLVFDARSRVGGRVMTARGLSTRYAEGGGEWIGLNHPRWIALADRFGLDLVEASEEPGSASVVIDGRRLSDAEAEGLYEEMTGVLSVLSAESLRVVDPGEPWLSDGAEGLDQTSVADRLATVDASAMCRRAIRAQFEHDNAVSLERMSSLGLLSMVAGGGGDAFWTDSEVVRCGGGNARLAEALAKTIGQDALRLGEPVRRIELRESGAVVHSDVGMIGCDVVVLATPPSTWGGLTIIGPAGEPVVPPAPQMGEAMKYLAAVDRPWWRARGLTPDSFSNGVLGYTWNGTDGQTEPGAEIINGFGGGPAVQQLPRDDGARRGALHRAVEGMVPGFAEAGGGSDPSRERVMMWPEDQWTRAGYAFPAPGEVTGVMREARQGVRVGDRLSLVLAGEHMSTAFVGYMEGALESGMRAADMVIGAGVRAKSASAGVSRRGAMLGTLVRS